MRNTRKCSLGLALLIGSLGLGGCSQINPQTRIEGLNARRLPDSILAVRRSNKDPIEYTMLRQDPPEEYVLDEGDTLGIYIAGLLGDENQPPPYLPDPIGNTPPAVGFPIPLQEGGKLRLPLLQEPIELKGKTITEAEEIIKKAYIDAEFINPDNNRILISLYRPRTYQVIVIREDGGGQLGQGQAQRLQSQDQTFATERGTGFILDMPAYENDVLRALMETGGLPGLDAKSEVTILRGQFKETMSKAKDRAEMQKNLGSCELPPLHRYDPNVVVIPTRLAKDETPQFTLDDIILKEGDVLVVEVRKRDVFYAGGLLGGAEVPLPRDYDLDVLTAIAVAGGPVGGTFRFGQGGAFSSFGSGIGLRGSTVSPSEATIIREAPFGNQIAIKVNLRKALVDPSQRILIKPGDVLVLDYTTAELWQNLILNTFPFNTLFNNLIFNQ